jgi:ataxin-3
LYTALDLSTLAQQLDAEENAITGNENSNSASGNYDDSGYFSIQVIQKALQIFGITLVPIGSDDQAAILARSNPVASNAYIFNLDSHWFTLRKFGDYWFNLNSVFDKPKFVSSTYLELFLEQVKTEGYSIFVVDGPLPPCDADEKALLFSQGLLTIDPDEDELEKAIKMSMETNSNDFEISAKPVAGRKGPFVSHIPPSEDDDLQRAIQASLGQDSSTNEDDEIQRAIKLSLLDPGVDSESIAIAMSRSLAESTGTNLSSAQTSRQEPTTAAQDLEMIRQKRLKRFG